LIVVKLGMIDFNEKKIRRKKLNTIVIDCS